MEWKKTTEENDDMSEAHYTSLKDGSSGILGEKSKLPLIIILGGVIFLVALFFIVNRPPKTAQQDTDVIESRLALLEKQTYEIDRITEKIAEMEARRPVETVSQRDIEQLTGAIKANAAFISEMEKKIALLEGELKKTAKKAQAPPVARAPEKPAPVAAPAAPAAAPPAAAKPADGLMYHTVQQGDTLYRLSVKYGISVPKLQELNNLGTGNEIFPGQQVIVGPVKP